MNRAPLLLLVVLVGCRPDAIHARVQIDPEVRATCVALDVLSPEGDVLRTEQVARPPGKDAVNIAVFQGAWGRDVQLQARALWGTACEGTLVPNGRSQPVAARFERQVGTFDLLLRTPGEGEDRDGDGFLSVEQGGADCDDGRGLQNPGALEVCNASEDRNCDGRLGCEDSACAGKAGCVWPARKLAFKDVVPVRTGLCTRMTVERQDASGTPTAPEASTTVTLTRTFPNEVGLYEDENCMRAASEVVIPAGDTQRSFFVRSVRPGLRELSATTPTLQSTSVRYEIVTGPATHLVLEPERAEFTADECLSLSLKRSDAWDNPVTGSDQTFSLAAVPLAQTQFFQEPGCVTPIATANLGVQQSSRTLYFRARRAGSVSVSVFGYGLSSLAASLTVRPGVARRLVLSPELGQSLLMSQCAAPVTASLQDDYSNPASLPTDSSLTLSGWGGDLFPAADTLCAAKVSSLPVPAGTSSASFRFRAGYNAGSLPLTVALGGLTAAQDQTVRPLVQRGTCSIQGGASSTACNLITPVASRDRSYFLFQASTNQDTAASAYIRCSLDSTSVINCSRRGNMGPVNISWQLVELPDGLFVQHVSKGCTGKTTTLDITAVEPTKTFLLASASQMGNNTVDGEDFMTVVLEGNNKVEIMVEAMDCATNQSYAVQVVQLDSVRVTRGFSELMSPGLVSVEAKNLEDQDPARTFVQATYRTNGTGNDICNRMVRAAVKDKNTLSFTRGAGSACHNSTVAIAYERITLANATVRSFPVTLPINGNNILVNLTSPVNPQRSVVFSSVQVQGGLGAGETAYAANDIVGVGVARFDLSTDGSGFTLSRDFSSAASLWTAYVLQFGP